MDLLSVITVMNRLHWTWGLGLHYKYWYQQYRYSYRSKKYQQHRQKPISVEPYFYGQCFL